MVMKVVNPASTSVRQFVPSAANSKYLSSFAIIDVGVVAVAEVDK